MRVVLTAPLITAKALGELLAKATHDLTVLDVRWQLATGSDRAAYLEGHLPGAVFVDLDYQLADPPSGRGRHPLPSAERLSAEMQTVGLSASRPVVVYDAGSSTAAARAWWLLRYFGHPQVAVLDGGLAAWAATGYRLERGEVSPAAGDFVAQPGAMPTVTPEQAVEVAARGVLLDARAPERFHGLSEPVDPVAGHIPGAVNRPTTDNLGPAAHFLDPSKLRSDFEALGVRAGAPVAAYCGSGVAACHQLLALELAGYRGALYPGSWSEWITDPARPVARA